MIHSEDFPRPEGNKELSVERVGWTSDEDDEKTKIARSAPTLPLPELKIRRIVDRRAPLPSPLSNILCRSGGSESKAQLVVRPSPPSIHQEMLVRHPLQSRRTQWYLEADRKKEWEDCLMCVSLFETVVESCALYNVMPMG
ncbi:hypothetical protein PRIPAC_71782 [Pristionchus pacificus]|uniref:Uncharacterized protein n=1 Tax=Pristionchus pacificus TaxID=54126 RepID=A0A2A6C1D8_PRIPA|nr:hypothetical protein PRIPAC_71782 [Pristionchus pacificus]|eukprot:PDM71984.1 hypothetical protein PRIPAC_38391 [Pristionchus pacificus]